MPLQRFVQQEEDGVIKPRTVGVVSDCLGLPLAHTRGYSQDEGGRLPAGGLNRFVKGPIMYVLDTITVSVVKGLAIYRMT